MNNILPLQNSFEIFKVNVTNKELLDKWREIESFLNMILFRLNILEVGPTICNNAIYDKKIRELVLLMTIEGLLKLELLNNDEDATQLVVRKTNI